MDVVIFKELTTNDQINELKVESEKYTGLYVDMEDKKQRKYVKDKAADIKTLIAKVERRRIDTVAEYKIDVEKEAASITEDLVIANLPFALLIDDYALARKAILDKEKALKLAVEVAVKLEGDHEFALLMNNKFDTDKINAEIDRVANEKQIADEAEQAAIEKSKLLAQQAIDDAEAEKQKAIDDKIKADAELVAAQAREKLLNEQAAQNKLNADWLAYISEAYLINDDIDRKAQAELLSQKVEAQRLADIETAILKQAQKQRDIELAEIVETKRRAANKKYMGEVHTAILSVLIANGISEKDGKTMIKLAAKAQLPQLTINY